MPADGWYAKYKNDDGTVNYDRVVCFALVDNVEPNGKHTQEVRAMDADGDGGYTDFADQATNFLGLSHESDKDFKAQRP